LSYTGSDDLLLCDGPCNAMAQPETITPWPVQGPVFGADGRMTSNYRDNFHMCGDCLREMILRSRLSPASRALAFRSRARWLASQELLGQAETVVRGSTA